MILDFKEIPEANGGSGLQDTFELFARDFLAYLGYRIIEDPNRGPDGKKDLIVEEVLSGIVQPTIDAKQQIMCFIPGTSFRTRGVNDT